MNRSSLFLLILTLSPFVVEATFTWDKDSADAEDCDARQDEGRCTRDETTFYLCPESCTKYIGDDAAEVDKQGEADDPDEFWELETPLNDSKSLSFERFEGYVTLVVTIPLMPGLGQYYFDMLEHILTVWPYSLEIMVFPIRREEHPTTVLKVPKKSKIIVLPELKRESRDKIEANPVLNYLEKVISPRKSSILSDRATAYIVAFNAKFIEKQASPTLDFLEKLISHYLTEMEQYLKSEF